MAEHSCTTQPFSTISNEIRIPKVLFHLMRYICPDHGTRSGKEENPETIGAAVFFSPHFPVLKILLILKPFKMEFEKDVQFERDVSAHILAGIISTLFHKQPPLTTFFCIGLLA